MNSKPKKKKKRNPHSPKSLRHQTPLDTSICVRQVKSLRSRKLNRSSTCKNQFQMHVLWFSFTPMSKRRKRPWNLYKYKTSLFKTYFSFIIEYGMYLRCLQKPCRLGWFKTSQALRSAVRLNFSKDNFIAKSFRLPTERKLSILLNFLFPFVSYRRIFNLEMQNFSLENHHMNACQPFCWWIIFQHCTSWAIFLSVQDNLHPELFGACRGER